jgi:hypothetical protein
MTFSFIKYFLLITCATSTHVFAQVTDVTISSLVHDKDTKSSLPYVNVVVKFLPDSTFVAGTVTNESGLFSLVGITPGNYVLELSYTGYTRKQLPLLVGRLSQFLNLGSRLNRIVVKLNPDLQVFGLAHIVFVQRL